MRIAIAGTMNIAPSQFRLSNALVQRLARLTCATADSAMTAMSDSPREKSYGVRRTGRRADWLLSDLVVALGALGGARRRLLRRRRAGGCFREHVDDDE